MKCPRCQHDNPQGARFCEECATPLARTCSNCGTALSATAKFCHACAHPVADVAGARSRSPDSYTPKHLAKRIINSKAALEGERKQVTVLFADLKGSMELLADRDPEEARKILDPVLELMMEAVHHYEGTVNQVMGDGIMALFGAPLAHEDHAVRACYAALRMQESVKRSAEGVQRQLGATVKIRVGLNSGEVVVRSIGSDLHMDYSAIGQTTHLAARMEQIADPGAVLLTPHTLALAEGFVEATPHGPMAVRGLSAPIEVYELTGTTTARSRLQAATPRGLTRFVGRDLELEQLLRALEQAQQGHGQLVAVVGEPGVGKSRLTFELTHSHHLDGWLVLHAGALSYGQATSYLPVIQLLKSVFRISDHDTPQEVREKLTSKVVALAPSLKDTLPALGALLDAHGDDPEWKVLDPARRRQRMLDAVKRLFLREAQVQPLLVIVEDLHWVDSETQALLQHLVDSLPTAKMLLLINYRPEYQHSWGSKTYYTQLRLDVLRHEYVKELLVALLGADGTVEPLKPVLIARTGGNPLFLEESVRTLVETSALTGTRGAYRLVHPVDSIDLPATVQALLASRIDRLGSHDKQLLQTASVVGKDVPVALLFAISEFSEADVLAGLIRLQASEFLYQTSLSTEPGYTFKHALTHEVTYESLLHDHRRTLHAQIVAAIETLHGDRLGGEIERLAYHAVRGKLREKAVDYLRQAGRKAAGRSALRDARAWLEQALGVLEALPENRPNLEQAFEIRHGLRPVLNQLGEFSQALQGLREQEILAKRLNDERRQGRVCAFLTNTYSLLGRPHEGTAYGARALEIASHLDDMELGIIARAFLAEAQYCCGEYERVVELACANLAVLPSDWLHNYLGMGAPASIYNRCWLSASFAQLGRFTEATEYESEAIRLAEPTHHAFTIGLAHYPAGTLHPLKGDWAKARAVIEDWIAVLRAGSVMGLLVDAIAASSWVLAQLGEASEALSRLRQGEQLLESRTTQGIGASGGWVYRSLGHACLLLGQLDEAQSWGERAVGSSAHQPGFAAHALHLLGEIAAHPDRFDAQSGEAYYEKALALAEPRGMRPLVAHCHLGLGKLYHRTVKREQAQEHLATATTMYREMGMTYWLEKAEAEEREI